MFGADYTSGYGAPTQNVPGQLSGIQSNGMPQFAPSGHTGVGGSAVPLSNDRVSRFYQMAGANQIHGGFPTEYQNVPGAYGRGDPGSGGMIYNNNLMHQLAQKDPSLLRTPGLQMQMAPPDMGVRPGAVPQMNAVQQARMAAGQPGQGNSGPNPRNAVLAAYPQQG